MKPLVKLLAWLVILCGHSFAADTSKPNFVFILVDDMPWFGTPVWMDAAL